MAAPTHPVKQKNELIEFHYITPLSVVERSNLLLLKLCFVTAITAKQLHAWLYSLCPYTHPLQFFMLVQLTEMLCIIQLLSCIIPFRRRKTIKSCGKYMILNKKSGFDLFWGAGRVCPNNGAEKGCFQVLRCLKWHLHNVKKHIITSKEPVKYICVSVWAHLFRVYHIMGFYNRCIMR